MKWYLDFGHGGKDPGALGSRNTKESDIVLKIGMLIKNNLVEASLSSSKYIRDIADSISSTLLSFVNKSIVDDGVFYRVCIGTYKDKSNAVKLKNEAISKGFKDTYIVTN